MRNFISGLFYSFLAGTMAVTIIVGVCWLFDFYPNNLYYVWGICYKNLAVSFLFHLLFGAKKWEQEDKDKITKLFKKLKQHIEKAQEQILTESKTFL